MLKLLCFLLDTEKKEFHKESLIMGELVLPLERVQTFGVSSAQLSTARLVVGPLARRHSSSPKLPGPGSKRHPVSMG